MSEYEDRLARVMAKNSAETAERRIVLRARRLLSIAGWDATADQLRAAAGELSQQDQIDEDELRTVIARAAEFQNNESIRGRRLRPEEIEAMPKTSVDKSTREKIRDYVFNRRRNEPNLTPAIALVDVNELFGARITYANFHTTYWKQREAKASSNGNGNGAKPYVHVNGANPTAPAKKAAKTAVKKAVKTTAKKPTRSTASARPRKLPRKQAARAVTPPRADVIVADPLSSVSAGLSSNDPPVVVGGPILQLYALSNGQLRVQADMDIERLTRVLHAVTSRED